MMHIMWKSVRRAGRWWWKEVRAPAGPVAIACELAQDVPMALCRSASTMVAELSRCSSLCNLCAQMVGLEVHALSTCALPGHREHRRQWA